MLITQSLMYSNKYFLIREETNNQEVEIDIINNKIIPSVRLTPEEEIFITTNFIKHG